MRETNKKGIEIKEICKSCGGKCCKTYPGPGTPEDFGAPDEKLMIVKLREALSSGRWTIDWIDQDEELYFVRPSVKGFEGSIFDHTYSGVCTFLLPNGCQLKFEERPESCRMLIPKIEEKCDAQGYTRMSVAKLWKQYATILLEIAVDIESIK